MHPLKKAYCRMFQTVMRLAMPYMPYRSPNPIADLAGVPTALWDKGVNRVLLVTDPTVRGLGLTQPLEDILARHGVACAVYDRTVSNPTTENVEEALELYKQSGCQGLIGFGGGSSIDCAKGVGARLAQPGKKLGQMEGLLKVRKKLPPLVAIPTTAGTGSETTLAAIITDRGQRRKYPVNDFPLMPTHVVLDPALTVSLTPQLTATTGMDAMTHAVEAFIGRSTTQETADEAIQAVKLILEYLPRAYADGNDLEARANMQRAAYLAGDAFTKSYVGYVHAVAHTLGATYGTPHGLANSVLLPIVLEQYGAGAHKRLAMLSRAAGVSLNGDDAAAAGAFIARIRALNDSMDIPRAFDFIREEDIPRMVKDADHEGNPLYPVPVLWGIEELTRIYHLAQEENSHDRTGDSAYTASPA